MNPTVVEIGTGWGGFTLHAVLGQGVDHPEVITIPETGYLKGAILRAD